MGLSRLSVVLIALQFALIGLMVWPFGAQRFGTVFWLLIAASVLLGVYTLLHNRLGNFNIRPEPKATAQLITTGPYQFIRHPMYSALLLATLAFAVAENIWLKVGLWIALTLVLSTKASFEEILMSKKFADYAAYRARSKRFIPFVF
jgi:protein-S-isoprenylcysteine O-methyltransferase Ste14